MQDTPQPDVRWSRSADHSPNTIFEHHILDISPHGETCEDLASHPYFALVIAFRICFCRCLCFWLASAVVMGFRWLKKTWLELKNIYV